MSRPRPIRSIAASLVAAATLALPAASVRAADQPVMPLAPHHATYKLTLLKSTGSKGPEAVEGLLSYDFTGSACDGYSMTLRQMTAFQPQEGDTRVSDMQTASFEDGAATDYRFKVATTGDANADGTVDGAAHRTSAGPVAVALARPHSEKIDLPVDVLFPTEHLKRVIATAKAGGKLLSAAVFDGSETGKKVFKTLSVIGAEITTPAPEKAADEALKGIRRWPVTISYFDAGKADEAPEYVLSFELYEDGVARGLKLDYGDFVLGGELTDLKMLPQAACAR